MNPSFLGNPRTGSPADYRLDSRPQQSGMPDCNPATHVGTRIPLAPASRDAAAPYKPYRILPTPGADEPLDDVADDLHGDDGTG